MWSVVLIFGAVILQVFDSVETTTAFNCRNSLISDEWREMVLKDVNDRRRILAKGQQIDASKNLLPKAKNMNQLNWDCNLEELAFKGIGTNCADWNDNNKNSPYFASQARFQKKKCDIYSQTRILLYAWWKEVEGITLPGDLVTTSQAGADFIQMATAETKAMACTYDICDKGTIVCLYANSDAIKGRKLYEIAASDGEICESCAKCENRLCTQTSTPVEIPPTCKKDKLTIDTQNTALWMHNYYRKLLASGWAKDPKTPSTYAPTAKQMLELEYECSANSYDKIKNCPDQNPTASPGYAMNFLRMNNYTVSEQDALEHAVKKWWSELELKGLGSDTTYKENAGITSFANMAFDQATKLSCAVQNCKQKGQTLVMCQYTQPITGGEKIYETGNVCSGCKNYNKKCSNDPRGLCLK